MATSDQRSAAYFPLLDAMRLLAAIGVVWLHVAGGPTLAWTKELGRASVPFFACSAVYLAYGSRQRHPQTSLGRYIVARFCRVYLLFLAWSLIYLVPRWVSAVFVQHTGYVKTSLIDFFWNGEAFQLWFLPVIFLATVAAFAIALAVRGKPFLRWPLLLIFAALAVCMPPASGFAWHFGWAAGLGYSALPPCFAGLALALAMEAGGTDRTGPSVCFPLLLAGAGFTLVWVVEGLFFGRSVMTLENVAGFGLLVAALGWSTRARIPLTVHLGALSLGIYLVHLLFVETMEHLLPKVGLTSNSVSVELSIFALSLAGSIITVELLRLSKWTRWLAG